MGILRSPQVRGSYFTLTFFFREEASTCARTTTSLLYSSNNPFLFLAQQHNGGRRNTHGDGSSRGAGGGRTARPQRCAADGPQEGARARRTRARNQRVRQGDRAWTGTALRARAGLQ